MKNQESTEKPFFVQDTKKYGKGVFANREIRKGETISIFTGEKISLSEVVQRVNSGKEFIDDPLQIGKRTYLDLDKISRTFNHSCDPNAGLRKTSELFAIRDIRKGEEITYDYSTTIAPTVWNMKCDCNTKQCRKVLGDIRSITPNQLKKYVSVGALQKYMQSLLRELKNRSYKIPKYELQALERIK